MKHDTTSPKQLASTILGPALVSALGIMQTPLANAIETENQQSDIDEMVVVGHKRSILETRNTTASKMDITLKDTGRSVTQLDQQQLQDRAINNIRQAFDYIASFRGNGPADRTYTARGVRTSIDNVMVDGLRSLQGGEAGTGSKLPTTFNAESTSFLRGPAGLLYGAGVGGGLVNITTRQPSAESNTIVGIENRSYLTDGSNFDSTSFTANLDTTGTAGSDDLLYRAIAQYTPSGEYFQEGREINEKLLDAALTYLFSEDTSLTARFESADRDRTGGSGYADGVFTDNFLSGEVAVDGATYGTPLNRTAYYGSSEDRGTNKSKSVTLHLKHQFDNDWTFDLRGRSNTTESESLDLYISSSSGLGNSVGEDEVDRKWVYSLGDDSYKLVDAALEGKFDTGELTHHFLVGVNYRDMDVKFARNFQSNDDALGQNSISVSNPANQLVGSIPADLTTVDTRPSNEKDINVYLKDRIKIDRFTVVAGLAYIKQDQSQTRSGESFASSYSGTIWDLGTIYALNDDTNLFATYSRSYDPISARTVELYGHGRTDYVPVEGENYEIGVKSSFLDDRLDAAVTLFRQDRINSTDYVYVDDVRYLVQLEGPGFRSKGVEIDAGIEVTSQWHTSLSYAFTRASDTIGDNIGIQASNTPKHSMALWNNYQLDGRWSDYRLGLGLRYESERNDIARNGSITKLEDYVEADAGIYYSADGWSAALVARNLFDKNRAEAGANWVTVQPK